MSSRPPIRGPYAGRVTVDQLAPEDTGHRGHVRSLFRLRGFRRLLAVRLVSQFGDGLFQAALAGSVLFNPAQQTSPVKIAIGFAVLLVPFSIIGPFAGVFLDRWSRRNIIFIANVIRAGLAVPGAILVGFSGAGLGFFTCALIITAINRFFLSGLSAAQPHVVPESQLVTANATASTLGTVAYSTGLGLTVVALHTYLNTGDVGYATLAAGGAIAYVAASLVARVSFRRDELGPDGDLAPANSIAAEAAIVARGMVAGTKHLIQHRQVAAAMGVQALCRLLFGILTLAILLVYSRYFYSTYTAAIGGLGEIVVVGSLGVIAAAFITPIATRRFGPRAWIIAMAALPGVVLSPLGLPFIPVLLVAATFLMNVSSQAVKIEVDTSVQVYCHENFRGRVFSVEDTLFNVLFVIGLFIGAIILPPTGHSPAAIVGISVGYLAVAAWYAVVTSRK